MATRFDYDVIVVGIDFSAPSREALARAADLAARVGARLEIIHVVRRFKAALPFSKGNRAKVAQIQKAEIARARSKLEKWKPRRRGLEVRAHVRTGVPSEGIIKHAEQIGADLIVLSNLGHNSFEEILIGSTAERCLRATRVPVLLVPHGGER